MYFNLGELGRDKGKRVTFFSRKVTVNGEKITHNENSVYGTLSEGIKTGENNGSAIWENDYWSTIFRGKRAYEKALTLKDKDRIVLVEFNVRNKYYAKTKKSYPQILVFDFDILSEDEKENNGTNKTSGEKYLDIPDDIDSDLPFH